MKRINSFKEFDGIKWMMLNIRLVKHVFLCLLKLGIALKLGNNRKKTILLPMLPTYRKVSEAARHSDNKNVKRHLDFKKERKKNHFYISW